MAIQTESEVVTPIPPPKRWRIRDLFKKQPTTPQDDGWQLLTQISPDVYLEKRVKQYMEWYNGKAVQAKSRYLAMRALAVMVGAVVPVLVNVRFGTSPR